MHYSKFTILLTALLSTASNAALLDLQFTDTNNEETHRTPTDTYLNPASNIDVVLSAGLDRKLRLTIINQSGTTEQTQLSGIVGVNDAITVDGKNYYGKSMTINRLYEGNYTFKAEILDYNDTVVQTDNYNFIVDTTAPNIPNDIVFGNSGGWGGGSIELFHYLSYRHFKLTGVTDIGSGLDLLSDRNSFYARLIGTQDKKRAKAAVDEHGTVSFDKPSTSTYLSLFTLQQSDYEIGFEVYDKAGNRATKSRTSSYDGKCGAMTTSDVWNPNTNTWEPYVSGMTAYSNPFNFRVKVAKADHKKYSGSKYGYNFTPGSEDDENVYLHYFSYIPRSYSYTTVYSDAGYCGTVHQNRAYAVLADGVDKSPQGTGFRYKVEGEDWINSRDITRSSDYKVSQVEISAEARNYDQYAQVSGYGGCIISANETSCVANGSYERNSSKDTYGYSPLAITYKSVDSNGDYDNRFSVHYSYFTTYWDFVFPEIVNVKYDDRHVEFNAYLKDATTAHYRSRFELRTQEVHATNISTGEVILMNPVDSAVQNLNTWWRKFEYANLPDGVYNIDAVAVDKQGNTTTERVRSNYLRDASSPTIKVTDLGSETFVTIQGLEGLVIEITDSVSDSYLTEVRLEGGPTNSVTNLTWRDLGSNRFSLEYPKIFPSLEEGTTYRLVTIGEDTAGNTATAVNEFGYIPPNMVNIGRLFTLPVSRSLLDESNKPISVIESTNNRVADGSLINGPQEMLFSLRSDADFPVIVEGVTIQAGETKPVMINAVNGAISVPVYPAVDDVVGNASFFIEIPQLQAH